MAKKRPPRPLAPALSDLVAAKDYPGAIELLRAQLAEKPPGVQRRLQLADLLLLAGDLTCHGAPAEMRCLASQLAELSLPVVAIFGNHGVHGEREGYQARAQQS